MPILSFIFRLRASTAAIVAAALACLLPLAAAAQPTVAELKAAYIYNFTRYVEWPAEVAESEEGYFEVCLAGRQGDPLFSALAELDGKNIRKRPLRIRHVGLDENLKSCAVMVIEKSDPVLAAEVIQRLKGQPTLTVSSVKNFLDLGGVMSLVTEGEKVRFDVNLGAARDSNLVLTFQLLKLARTVKQP